MKPETVIAIAADQFAKETLTAVRAFIYAHFRDWDRITTTGKLPFTDDNAAVCYAALSALLGTLELPDIGETKVKISDVPISARAIEELQAAFK